jgi:hypothetical protein
LDGPRIELLLGSEDPDRAPRAVVHEHRFWQPEGGRNFLTPVVRDFRPIEEDRERTSAAAIVRAEDTQQVESRHEREPYALPARR